MAHSLSAKKRVRQNAKKKVINRSRKSELKSSLKSFAEIIKGTDKAKAAQMYKQLAQKADKIAAKGTIHKNKAARLKSRQAKKLNKLK